MIGVSHAEKQRWWVVLFGSDGSQTDILAVMSALVLGSRPAPVWADSSLNLICEGTAPTGELQCHSSALPMIL
jgi:hypothetical protein